MKIIIFAFILVVAVPLMFFSHKSESNTGYFLLYKFQASSRHNVNNSFLITMPIGVDKSKIIVKGSPVRYEFQQNEKSIQLKVYPGVNSGIIQVGVIDRNSRIDFSETHKRRLVSKTDLKNCNFEGNGKLFWPDVTIKDPELILESLSKELMYFNVDDVEDNKKTDVCEANKPSVKAKLWSEYISSNHVVEYAYVDAYKLGENRKISLSTLSSWFIFNVNGHWLGMQLDGNDSFKLSFAKDLLIFDREYSSRPVYSSGYRVWQL